jgi:hypothetical protein
MFIMAWFILKQAQGVFPKQPYIHNKANANEQIIIAHSTIISLYTVIIMAMQSAVILDQVQTTYP